MPWQDTPLRALQHTLHDPHSAESGVQVVLEGGERLEYGVCVWSTGNAARPLVQSIAGAVPAQREALQVAGHLP